MENEEPLTIADYDDAIAEIDEEIACIKFRGVSQSDHLIQLNEAKKRLERKRAALSQPQ